MGWSYGYFFFWSGLGDGCSFFIILATLNSEFSNQDYNSVLNMRYLYFVAMVMSMLFPARLLANVETVFSPSHNIAVNFEVKEGVPVYNVVFNGKEVIKESRLGLELVSVKGNSDFGNFDNKQVLNQSSLLDGFTLMTARYSSFDETWQPVWARKAASAITITRWLSRSISPI